MSAKAEAAIRRGDIVTEDDLDLGEWLNWFYWRHVLLDGD